MHFVTAAMLFATAQACFQAHSYFQGDPFVGDILSMQVWDNGVKICDGGKTKTLSSDETEWCLEAGEGCNAGYRACFTDNGKSGYVTNLDVDYTGDISQFDTHDNTFDCYCTDESCLNCPETESCLSDFIANCDNYKSTKCALCDYRSTCQG